MYLKGYIFSRSFFEDRVPQHVQNIVIRDYCKKNQINLLLSATEYKIRKSSFILMELIKKISQFDGLIFYSLFQLPEDNNLRKKVYQIILNKKKVLHFAVENMQIKTKEDVKKVEEIFILKKLSFLNQENYNKKKPKLVNFVTPTHKKTKRKFIERMVDDKVACMKTSKQYGFDYWDGKRRFGYGGYKYIPGYHKKLATKMIDRYSLNNNSKILDIGCGKGFLIYELKKILKKIDIKGIDKSKYAIRNAKKEIKESIFYHDINSKLNYEDNYFDLVISINTLHNLKIPKIEQALKEINRISKNSFICVESYRNEKEQFNLQCWALTAETIIDTQAWKWLFSKTGYNGDYEFIYF